MSFRYVVVSSPYGSINGEYNPDVAPNQFIHTDKSHYLYFDNNEQRWSLSDEKTIMCRASFKSAEPPHTGWDYWKSNDGAYVKSANMMVVQKPLKSEPAPLPAAQPQQANTHPDHVPDIIPESTRGERPPFVKEKSVAWPEQQAAPRLKPCTIDAEGWEQRTSQDWVGRTSIVYFNTQTGVQQSHMPEAFRIAQSKVPNIAATELPSANLEHPVLEVFAPVAFAKSQKKPIKEASFYDQWVEIEPLWSYTVSTMEQELITLKSKLAQGHDLEKNFQAERKALNEKIAKLDATLQDTKGRERQAQQKSDTMISRVGKSHIKRDWQQTTVESEFPTGEDLRAQFVRDFVDFESFACDAVNCLEDLGHEEDDAANVLVRDVLTPIYTTTLDKVNTHLLTKKGSLKNAFGGNDPDEEKDDSIAKLFWYSTMQMQMPKTIKELTDAEIDAMMGSMHPKVTELHQQMLTAEKQNMISSGEGTMRFPQVTRILLYMQTVAALSDPRCFLLPAPGVRMPYKEGFCQEVLSPGVKKHGRIKEGDTVEVVLPGLYFDNPTDNFATVKPIVPCLVRRLMNTAR